MMILNAGMYIYIIYIVYAYVIINNTYIYIYWDEREYIWIVTNHTVGDINSGY